MRRALASPPFTGIFQKFDSFSTISHPRDGSKEFPSAYKPSSVESDWYEWWYHNNYFLSRLGKEYFSMILPPPNVTGNLHLGHALTVTIQDVLARRERMGGNSVVWLPGTDHAGIATQAVVEKILLKKEGKTRHDVGREEFIKNVWKWKEEKTEYIGQQLKHMGASLDWQRSFFTMDKHQCEAVTEAFLKLWEGGLIYRKEGLVNWSCHLRSAISDIEVNHIPVIGPTLINVPGYSDPLTFGQMMFFSYKSADVDDEVVVGTTRLETMLGDVGVAVHPQDQRYKHLWGTRLIHPFTNEAIPIVLDDKIDPTLASGAVKVTPAHNIVDYEIALSHHLPIKVIFNPDGTLAENCGQFAGMKRFEAREVLKVALEELGLFRGVKDHSMQLPICSRSGDVIEFFPKPQWYVSCKGMAERAADALKTGSLVIEPVNYHKEWFDWLENIRDWCVSRQLWWGHRIPMYECSSGEKSVWIGAKSEEEAQMKGAQLLSSSLGSLTVKRDTDVLDTWFSSSLLPFSSLGWPSRTMDLKKYYPLSIMVTGHDILFFWVARMVMMSLQLTNQLPFKKVLLHGVICDAMGRKMSKSLGNVVNPEDIRKGVSLEALTKYVEESASQGVLPNEEAERAKEGLKEIFPHGIPECGVDALRFTLLSHNVKSRYINFNVRECNSNRLFCNKIWQATRFVRDWSTKLDLEPSYELPSRVNNPMSDWILSKASKCVQVVNDAFKDYNFHLATSAIREFVYSNLCDIYLESIKPVLKLGGDEGKESLSVLLFCLQLSLRLLSPFMPYLSEELYCRLPGSQEESITIAPFPTNFEWRNIKIEDEIETVMEVVAAIRRLKNTYWLNKKNQPSITLMGETELMSKYQLVIKGLSKCETIDVTNGEIGALDPPMTASESISGIKILLNLEKEAEEDNYLLLRPSVPNELAKLAKMEKELEKLLRMVQHEGYSKAPPNVQQAHSEKISKLKAEIEKSRALTDCPSE